MTQSQPGIQGQPGNRRIDRVLADDYLDNLSERSLAEVRELRGEAEQEEVDLSYLRRLLQGRMDIVQAELDRRAGGGTADLVHELPRILADEAATGPRGSGRHTTAEPSRADAHRRHVEMLVADVDLSNVAAHDGKDLARILEVLRAEERSVSDKRRRVQTVMDACATEIARRYRDGQADVADLLAPDASS